MSVSRRGASKASAGEWALREGTVVRCGAIELAVLEPSIVADALRGNVKPRPVGLAGLEDSLQLRPVFPRIKPFAVGTSFDEGSDVTVGARCLPSALRRLRPFVAVPVVMTAQVRIAHDPTFVRERRDWQG